MVSQHEDTHFDSFNKLCFAVNHEMDDHVPRGRLVRNETINLQMYYLILIVSGEIIDIFPTKKELKLRSTDHIHYVQSYVNKNKEQQYHIDVVTEKYLPRLLSNVSSEADETAKRIKRHHPAIQTSINKLVASVRDLRSSDAIQERLKYDPVRDF